MTGSEDTSVIVWDIKTQVVKTRLWWAFDDMQARDWTRAYNLLNLEADVSSRPSESPCIAPKHDLLKEGKNGKREWMLWEKPSVPPADDDGVLFSARYSGSSG